MRVITEMKTHEMNPGGSRFFFWTVFAFLMLASHAAYSGSLHLRVGPSYLYPEVVTLPVATALNPVERRQEWLRVEAESYEGWIHVSDLLENISPNRPHPEQFRYSADPDSPYLDLFFTTEQALGVGLDFESWGQELSLRGSKTTSSKAGWSAIEFGGRTDLYEAGRWKIDFYMALGVGSSKAGTHRWGDGSDKVQVPLFSVSSDFEWHVEKTLTLGIRAQIQKALAENGKNHGALALVWRVML